MKERRMRTVKDGQASKLRQRSVEIMMAPRAGNRMALSGDGLCKMQRPWYRSRECGAGRRERKARSKCGKTKGKRSTAKRAKGDGEGYGGPHHSQANVTIVECEIIGVVTISTRMSLRRARLGEAETRSSIALILWSYMGN